MVYENSSSKPKGPQALGKGRGSREPGRLKHGLDVFVRRPTSPSFGFVPSVLQFVFKNFLLKYVKVNN